MGLPRWLPANGEDLRDAGLIPGRGRSPGGGHSNPLQFSFLKTPMEGEAWRAKAHRVAELDMTEANKHASTHTYVARK